MKYSWSTFAIKNVLLPSANFSFPACPFSLDAPLELKELKSASIPTYCIILTIENTHKLATPELSIKLIFSVGTPEKIRI